MLLSIPITLCFLIAGCTQFAGHEALPVGSASRPRLVVGMNFDDAITIIKREGGEDVSKDQQRMAPPGAAPIKNRCSYWRLHAYQIQISIGESRGRLSDLSYWDERDLGVSKLHDGTFEQRVKSMTFDSKSKMVVADKPAPSR
jgi:hypothetical protein